jgi:hypothetical protein
MNRLIILSCLISFSSLAQTTLLETNFQAGIPSNYTIVDNDGLTPAAGVSEYTNAWITITDPSDSANKIAASTSFFQPTGKANRWLITPALPLGAYGNFITWKARSQDASFPDSYVTLISTSDKQLTSFTDTISSIQGENVDWTTRTVNLSAKNFNNDTIYIAFVNRSDNAFKLYLDDIKVWKEDPLSVQSLDNESNFTVYPNPTNGTISLSTEATIENIRLFSANGELLIAKPATSQLDLTQLPNGVYYLIVQTNQGTATRKVIKF